MKQYDTVRMDVDQRLLYDILKEVQGIRELLEANKNEEKPAIPEVKNKKKG